MAKLFEKLTSIQRGSGFKQAIAHVVVLKTISLVIIREQ